MSWAHIFFCFFSFWVAALLSKVCHQIGRVALDIQSTKERLQLLDQVATQSVDVLNGQNHEEYQI
jgi:hypothetical protein